MDRMDGLLSRTLAYFTGYPRQIQHLLKVRAFAVLIGKQENFDECDLARLEAAGIVHDVGIRAAMERFGRYTARLQEELGPEVARGLMAGWPEEDVERVCWLVAHHHTLDSIREIDHQALVEADFLVNLYEHDNSREEIERVLATVFKTGSGKQLCRTVFGLDAPKEGGKAVP